MNPAGVADDSSFYAEQDENALEQAGRFGVHLLDELKSKNRVIEELSRRLRRICANDEDEGFVFESHPVETPVPHVVVNDYMERADSEIARLDEIVETQMAEIERLKYEFSKSEILWNDERERFKSERIKFKREILEMNSFMKRSKEVVFHVAANTEEDLEKVKLKREIIELGLLVKSRNKNKVSVGCDAYLPNTYCVSTSTDVRNNCIGITNTEIVVGRCVAINTKIVVGNSVATDTVNLLNGNCVAINTDVLSHCIGFTNTEIVVGNCVATNTDVETDVPSQCIGVTNTEMVVGNYVATNTDVLSHCIGVTNTDVFPHCIGVTNTDIVVGNCAATNTDDVLEDSFECKDCADNLELIKTLNEELAAKESQLAEFEIDFEERTRQMDMLMNQVEWYEIAQADKGCNAPQNVHSVGVEASEMLNDLYNQIHQLRESENSLRAEVCLLNKQIPQNENALLASVHQKMLKAGALTQRIRILTQIN